MKNILTTVASATVGIFLFIILPGIGGYIDSYYIKEDCKIIEIAEDFIVAEDKHEKYGVGALRKLICKWAIWSI